MTLIASDKTKPPAEMLEAYDCPAILVTSNYQIVAYNTLYENAFGSIELESAPRCFSISHGYDAPCDESGESCPLGAARASGHKERVLHIHQTPRGKEHVDVEMLPIHNTSGELIYFVELLRPVPLAGGAGVEKELVGNSPAFNEMLSKIARVGTSEASVLLLGESGTGKELAARAIHMASPRKNKPLVTLECAGLSDTLFESELFGHVKGAFTGAQFAKKGLVELANDGTLFLDELGDIPLSMQVKLLRLIETGTYRPVGSIEVRSSNFRLICATHKKLYQMVENGQFREDLYYRINVYPITVPALRDRKEDIPLLAKAILDRLSASSKFRLTESATQALLNYPYRGNIRELRNLLNRAIVLCDSNIIDQHVIDACIEAEPRHAYSPESEEKANSQETVEKEQRWLDLATQEKRYISEAMAAHKGNKEKVAQLLGISLRSLYRKLQS
ncbi:MAG: sigma-54 dependent transcriptional regulator [Pseudohongiellaceae bacterium]|nr:sigma-54 dependent transcriptional regulator [Pseudohongiellaceae bacterium]